MLLSARIGCLLLATCADMDENPDEELDEEPLDSLELLITADLSSVWLRRRVWLESCCCCCFVI